jgi:hypothetical protein
MTTALEQINDLVLAERLNQIKTKFTKLKPLGDYLVEMENAHKIKRWQSFKKSGVYKNKR